MKKFISPARLRELGILGMNARNFAVIGKYNDRSRYPLVDDKLKTKLLAKQFGLATPALLGVIRHQHAIKHVAGLLDGLPGFAIKPANGSGGKGILVVTGHDGPDFIKSSGATISLQDTQRHLSNILAGLYSLGGQPDVVIVEELIAFDERFAGLSHQGVPDIRIIVFHGYPVMAMLRLATRDSDGKANLHQGAIGVGLDIATGRPLNAVQYNKRVYRHPDTGAALDSIVLDNWEDMLLLASRCHEMTGLCYLGVDLVLDRDKGALILELNARPGLSIQVANGLGLAPRIRKVEALLAASRTTLPGYYRVLEDHPPHRSPAERVVYSVQEFAEPPLDARRVSGPGSGTTPVSLPPIQDSAQLP